MIDDKQVEELLRYVAEQRLKSAPVNKQAVLNILDIKEPEPEMDEVPDFQRKLASLGQTALTGNKKWLLPAIGAGIGVWLFMRNK